MMGRENTIQNVYIAGLGAIGATFASKIHEIKPGSLRVICNQERIQRYTQQGVTVNGKAYAFRYLEPGGSAPPADLILIAVKHHQLSQAIEDIKKFVSKDTIILSLLNGISSEETIGEVFSADHVLPSFVVGTDAVRENMNIRYTNIGKIVFGAGIPDAHSGKVAAVGSFFNDVRIPYKVSNNILRDLWWKFMVNVGINQVSTVLRAPYGVFQKIGDARELMLSAAREVIRLSQNAGIHLNQDDLAEFIRIINSLSPEGKTSMLQDIEAGRKTEVEIFAGTVLALGRQYKIQTPVNETLYKIITIMEKMNSPSDVSKPSL
jgi:2-dehydropantoate 2-reductase